MRTLDKVVLSVLALIAAFLFFYGFNSITGYAVAVEGAAVGVGQVGKAFWLGLLGVLIVALVFMKARGKR